MSRDVFETLDSGKRRSAADVLGIEGHKNAMVLTTSARFVIRTLYGRGRYGLNPSNAQVNACVKAYPRLDHWCSQYAGSKMKSFMPATIPGLLVLAEKAHGTDLVEEFFQQVATGIGVTNESPAYTLREKFIEFGRGGAIARPTQDAFMIKAMNAHIQGKKLKLLRMTPTEATPQLIGLPD
jgi:hypothetical protein